MADVFTKAKRSAVMACIRSSGNKSTEIALARLLRSAGITGWRRHRHVIGKPDFVFRKQRVAVFVDGCFWHGCPEHGARPKTNASFWRRKIARNRARDREVNRLLRAKEWRVFRIWEHELAPKNKKHLAARMLRRLVRLNQTHEFIANL